MKKIRVVQIVPMLGPGGAERVVVDIATGLNRERFETGVISIWRRTGCELESALDNSDVKVEYLGKGWGFDGRTFHRLHGALRDFRPDVVHTHLQVLRYAFPSLLLHRPALTLHTVHNLAEREVERRAQALQKYAFRHGVMPIAVSKEVSLSLKRLYGVAPSRVIANGIRTSHYANPQVRRQEWRARVGFKEEHVLFVCVARLMEQKNHALLLKAFAQGPAPDSRAQLMLVGDGPLGEKLQAQAESLGIARQVHFLGLRSDVAEVLGASDGFVMSSDWEGNPLSVMEAMASGLPLVCTAAGGVPDLFANGREGFLVQPGDGRGLANSMAFLLTSAESRLAMGAAGARRAKEYYDVSRMVHAYEQLYEKAIAGTRLPRTEIMKRGEHVCSSAGRGRKTRIMHVITTMGPAGAETMLCRIAAGMDTSRFENEVVSLTGILDLAEKMHGIGVKVRTLGMKKSIPNPLLVMRLARWIRKSKPDVIHTWMYHANLLGALAARVAGNVPVVWSIHHNSLDANLDNRRTLLVNRACSFLSKRLPARIVCCSEASLQLHRSLGYAPEKLEVIPNGVDSQHLRPDSSARDSLREELGIPVDSPVIGIAARFHPHKDHRNFILAASRLHQHWAEVHFVLCGMGITWQNSELSGWIEAMGLRHRCHLLGPREDVPRLFSAMDIACTSSRSEAFPVAICEAMACGTPCVVTDVGDSAMIVGETGMVVPARDPAALADGWRKLLDAGPDERRRLGMAGRERVKQHFALPTIVERYQAIYSGLVAGSRQVTSASSVSQCA